jgi:hypothetical protein
VEPDEAGAASLLDRRTAAQPAKAKQSVIVWSVGDSLFGTEVAAVAGVIPFAGCARVPTREASCLGVIGRGGRFYSVIGMRRLLSMPAGDGAPGHLLLLRGAAPSLALAVDRVLGRFDLAAGGAAFAPAFAFEGRLVAAWGPAELRDRLGHASLSAPSVESIIS